MTRFERKLIRLGRLLVPHVNVKSLHVSFVVHHRRILSTGVPQGVKTHTLSNRFGYFDSSIHAEVHAITKLNAYKHRDRFQDYFVYNVRFDRAGCVRMSRPCSRCQAFCASFGIRRIFFTDDDGLFRELCLESGDV